MPGEVLDQLAGAAEGAAIGPQSVLILSYSQYIIYGAATLAVLWGAWKAHLVSQLITV